jgi:hypothetical protein
LDLKELQVVLSGISDPHNLLVWRAGFEGWQRAGNVPELAEFIDKPPPLPQTTKKSSFMESSAVWCIVHAWSSASSYSRLRKS